VHSQFNESLPLLGPKESNNNIKRNNARMDKRLAEVYFIFDHMMYQL